ncbi:asparagine--tRNA ligase, cytoplasmic 1-like protein [Tanacetum coccineum]
MSSECNNVKLAIRNDKSEIVCAMCKQCLITTNHDVCVLNYMNGMNSRGKQQKANVSNIANQTKHKPQVWKPKNVGSKERLASPKPSKPRMRLRWSPTGRIFYLCGKLIRSSDSEYLEVAFRRNTCFIRNLEGVDLLKGNRTTNLYTINIHDMASTSPICLMAQATSTKSWLRHQRLSHLNFDTINDLARNDLVTGLPKFKYHKEHLCPFCEQGKGKRASHPPKPVPNSKQRLHLLHMDLCGPMRIASINGKRYVLVIVDEYSRYTWVIFLRSKDEAPEEIKTFLKKITVLLQAPVIIVRTDNDTEFKNQVLQEYFNSVGISHQTSSVRTPQQNAIATACYTQNRYIIHRRFDKTPYKLINGRKPDISFLHVFGAICYPKNDHEDIRKLGAKGDIGFLLVILLIRVLTEFVRFSLLFTSTNMHYFRLLSSSIYVIHNGFLYVHTPIITTSDCEGAGEMFQVTTLINDAEKLEKELIKNPPPSQEDVDVAKNVVKEKGEIVAKLKSDKAGKPAITAAVVELDKAKENLSKLEERFNLKPGIPKKDGKIDYSQDFFARQAFLTVSGQLQAETYACALGSVYTFGPTFRAEHSHTSRHLAEFWMVEPEIAFADIEDDMRCNFEKNAIKRLQMVASTKFVRLSCTEAVIILEEVVAKGHKFENHVEWGVDLASEHEKYLTEIKFESPMIVYNYPKGIKAFYMKLNDDKKTVAAMDVLVPKVGELIGGSQREENYEVIKERILKMGLPLEPYEWYLDLRRYGTVKHSGFGLGFERMILFAIGIDNIRDVIPFPRFPGRTDL